MSGEVRRGKSYQRRGRRGQSERSETFGARLHCENSAVSCECIPLLQPKSHNLPPKVTDDEYVQERTMKRWTISRFAESQQHS